MSHQAWRIIAEKINNQPLLITEAALAPVLDYLENRTEAAIHKEETKRANAPSIAERTAMIPISGSLSYSKTWMGALCGMTSYQQLIEDVEYVLDRGAKVVVLDCDSGGGEAYACFETGNTVKKMCQQAGAKLIAYVDGTSASAAYALSCVADEVIANPMAEVGSIGVLIRLVDSSEAQKKAGFKSIFVTSAKSKVPFGEDGKFKADFIEDLQQKVDKLHTSFVSHVANARGMSEEVINNTEAKVFDADKALELGLIDKVMEHEEFFEYLAELEESTKPMGITSFFKPKAAQAATQQEDDEAMKLAELQAQYDELSAQMEASANQLADMQSTLSEATAALQGKDAELQAALSELQAIKTAEVEKVNAAKMAKLAAVYGDDKAAEMFADLSALPEATFDAIVSAKRADNQAVEQSTMFQEMGVTVEDTQAEAITQEDYLAQRLAAKAKKQ